MIIWTTLSQKGGSGKTTLAVNLAVAALADGFRPAVIDIDPQSSAAGWADRREDPWPLVRTATPGRLARAIEDAGSTGADLVVVDTAPHAEAGALAAARAADLALIPCRPSLLDLQAVPVSVDIARLAGTPPVAVLNAAPWAGTLAAEARAALAGAGLAVLPQAIPQRSAFVHAATQGLGVVEHEPRGKAAAEIRTVLGAVRAWPDAGLRLVAG